MEISFNVPSGTAAQISIIDTKSRISCIPTERLMSPPLSGFENLPEMPSLSFLIENQSGRKALFDLSIPLDWQQLPPIVAGRLNSNGYVINPKESVSDVLKSHGVNLQDIDSIIWSHWHWDHLGNPSEFPSSVEIVVGPGFKEAFVPAFPAGPLSTVRQKDFLGRKLREIIFDDSVKVGRFRAFDFFGDGSFYLLDTPGHAIGHLGGLVRTTTQPDTFIMLGGDLCHHSSEMRPSKFLSMPLADEWHDLMKVSLFPCPGFVTETLQKRRLRAPDEPFFNPARGVPLEEAIETIQKSQEADAQSNVLFIYAHDREIPHVADMFPCIANDWKSKGLREKLLWAFLKDFKHLE